MMYKRILLLSSLFLSATLIWGQSKVYSQAGSSKIIPFKDSLQLAAKKQLARESLKKGMLLDEKQMVKWETLQSARLAYIRALMQNRSIINKDSARNAYDARYNQQIRKMLTPEQLRRWEQFQAAKQRAIKDNKKQMEERVKAMQERSVKPNK